MLRSLDEKGGIGVYARYLTEELLALDGGHEYVLFYQNAEHRGRFGSSARITERVIPVANKVVWDQLAVPYLCWREGVDVVLHPKFTVPLLAPCRTAMVLHGAGWFMPEVSRFWNRWDLRYLRLMMPVYCRRASAVLAVSRITKDVFDDLFRLPDDKITTVYFGPGRQFRRVEDAEHLESIRSKYDLPDRFILTLSKYGDGGRKNIDGILAAYERVHGTIPHQLVVGGKDCERYRSDYGIPNDGFGRDIRFPGWIDQADLPALYSLADLFLYPSHVEAFPIPITEALACGTPIVTSDANGLREIAGEAGLLVNPRDPADIAEAVRRALSDPELLRSLSARSLERSTMFSWEKCARETMAILESAVA
jgi:glycosyltransferase involved in cell wall biosynthesis